MNNKISSTWRSRILSSSLLVCAAAFLLVLQASDLRAADNDTDKTVVESNVQWEPVDVPAAEPAEQSANTDSSTLPLEKIPAATPLVQPAEQGSGKDTGPAPPAEQAPGQDTAVKPPDESAPVPPNEIVPTPTEEPKSSNELRGYSTKHYIIYTQLSEEKTRDLAHRLEAMYDYYSDMFSGVCHPDDKPKEVYLYNNRADFVAAGGHPTMPGQSMMGPGGRPRVMMICNEDSIEAFMTACPLLYHEGFHQFVSTNIAGRGHQQWPLWLDESFATNFNNITWTGDGWVEGNLRIEYALSATSSTGSFIPLTQLLNISNRAWQRKAIQGTIWPIYMEGMSMVYFLCFGNDAKNRPLLINYVKQVSSGNDSNASAQKIVALQSEFVNWFQTKMNPHITGAKYYEIFTAMVTSQLARAHARGQRFESGKDFLLKVESNKLSMPSIDEPDWLPDSLRQEILFYFKTLTLSYDPFKFNIEYPADGGTPVVHVSQPRFGLELKGTFNLDESGKKVAKVDVKYVRCPSLDLREAKRIAGTKD